jgi:beta-glucosidase
VSTDAPVAGASVNFLIAQAEVIIAVMGNTPAQEGEECDRDMLGLPGRQLELLQRLAASGIPVVLVLTGGSPLDLGWIAEHVPAILLAWYPGEQGGHAVAQALFGEYNPAGRLPVSLLRSYANLPPFADYAMAGRTYRFMSEPPLYPFGYGLSYSRFAYSNLKVNKRTLHHDESLKVSVRVENVGDYPGDEVVQLYLSDVAASVPVPLRQLKGFQRLPLRPGQRKTVRFTLTPEDFHCYRDDGTPLLEPGEFSISVGSGQPGMAETLTVNVMVK